MRRPHPQPGRLLLVVGLTLSLTAASRPTPVRAQLSAPCQLACGLVLGAAGVTFATGAVVAVGRASGGIDRMSQAVTPFGVGFAAFVGSGLALGGSGPRQERAVYAAGLGSLAGALAGLTVGSTIGGDGGPRRLAATLIGAAAGALVGGAVGALSHDSGGLAEAARLSLRISF